MSLRIEKLLMTAIVVAAVGPLVGCAPPVKKDVGQLSLEYRPTEKRAATGKAVAIVAPQFVDSTAQRPPQPRTALEALLLAQMQKGQQKPSLVDFHGLFGEKRTLIARGFQSAFTELLSAKGFRITGQYGSLDEIPFPEKKAAYLAVVPRIQVALEQKQTSSECSRVTGVCTDEGEVQVGGEFFVALIEPLTQQAVIARRFNLSEFEIRKAYVKQFNAPQGSLLSVVARPSQLTDNTDKVFNDAVNEFFAQSMAKIDKLLSQEELLSLEKDVNELKAAKALVR